MAIFQSAGKVGVTGAQARHRLGLKAFLGRRHLGRPVDVVLVFEHERDRAADREPAPHAADDARDVGLDLLPPAAAVAALPAGEIAAKIFCGDLEARGQALDHDCELRSVRLA